MATYQRPRHRSDFEIAVICALSVEFNAVEALFDAFWEDKGHTYGKAPGDPNAYTTGRIGRHNVVLAFMPGMGRGAAAGVAAAFRGSFPNIKLGLVVGICGGVPSAGGDDADEIVLGDVVVSTGVVQYDFGRQFSDKAVRKDTLLDNLGRPSVEIRSFLAKLSGLEGRKRLKADASAYLGALTCKEGFEKSKSPGATEDRLYRADYRHKHQDPKSCPICAKCTTKDDKVCDEALEATCLELGCSSEQVVVRKRTSSPSVHFGLIASGDTVMKSGYHRDQIAKQENVIAFEMEGAGVWSNFPTIVIKSVCDYADSHKNKSWQRHAAACAAAFMKAILDEWRLTDRPAVVPAGREPEARSYFYVIPRLEVPRFFGRDAILRDIGGMISAGPRNSYESLVLVLQAMGGQGKTQLALRVCQQAKKDYRGIFWVDAASRTTAERGFEKIAGILNTKGQLLSDSAAQIRFVNELLESWDERWLLVLDNYDEPHNFKDIKEFMPLSPNGIIIVTSRHEASLRLGTHISVPSMIDDGGKSLLLDQYWNKGVDDDEDEQIERVLQRLGGLALAIDQAAAYINYRKISLLDFLTEYERKKETILKHTHEQQWEYHSNKGDAFGAFTTWELSFEQIESNDQKRKQHLADFLGVCAYLEPTRISEDIFRLYHSEADESFPWLELFVCDGQANSSRPIEGEPKAEVETQNDRPDERAWDKDCFWNVISQLHRFSLLQKISSATSNSSPSFSVHPVVRDWLQVRQHGEAQRIEHLQQSFKLLATLTQREYPKKRLPLSINGQLVAHLDAVVLLHGSSSLAQVKNCQPMYREKVIFARFYLEQGLYKKTQDLLEQILAEDTDRLPATDVSRLRAMNELSWTLLWLKEHDKAEKLAAQAVPALKQVLGEEHVDVLRSMSHLAVHYIYSDHVEEAEKLSLQVLEICKRALEEDHPVKLTAAHNLATVYSEQKRFPEAEALSLQILEPEKRVLGEDHQLTLKTLYNLAIDYTNQSRLAEAEKLYLQVLEIRRRVFGDNHPDTIDTMYSLGLNLARQERLTEAEQFYSQALEIQNQVQGENHPDTLQTMHNLAFTYSRQQRVEEAERLYSQVLEMRTQALGANHLDTLYTMHNLAVIYSRQQRFSEAERLYSQALEMRTKALGEIHLDTLHTMHGLGWVQYKQGNLKAAESVLRRAFELRRQVLGEDHTDTLYSKDVLALVLLRLDHRSEGMKLATEATDARLRIQGPDHPDTIWMRNEVEKIEQSQPPGEVVELDRPESAQPPRPKLTNRFISRAKRSFHSSKKLA